MQNKIENIDTMLVFHFLTDSIKISTSDTLSIKHPTAFTPTKTIHHISYVVLNSNKKKLK